MLTFIQLSSDLLRIIFWAVKLEKVLKWARKIWSIALDNNYYVYLKSRHKILLDCSLTISYLRNLKFLENIHVNIGFTFFLPFPVRGSSVHISFTFSKTILQCLSNALTRPRSFLLFLQFINTCVLFLTDCVRTERGPVLNSSSSLFASSSGVISDFGLVREDLKQKQLCRLMTQGIS